MTRVPVTDLGKIGIVRDTYEQSVPPNAFSRVVNARFDERGAVAFPGHRKVFTQAPVTPLWYKQFPPTNLPRWVYTTLTEAWVVENDIHTEVTRVASDYTAVATERWHGNLFNGLGIFNNTQDAPQQWAPMTAATKFVDLVNWPANYRCKFIRPFGNFLVAGNIYDGSNQRPFRLKWSSPAAAGAVPSSWDHTDPAEDANERDLAGTSDELVDCLPMDTLNIVYREYSAWGMRFVGFPNIFQTWPITTEHGAMARDCAVDTPLGHVVLTRDDVVVHRGTKESFQSLIAQQYRRTLFKQINSDYWYKCCVARSDMTKEIWICFPESGADVITQALVINWEGHGIGFRELPNVPFVASGPVGPALVDDTG